MEFNYDKKKPFMEASEYVQKKKAKNDLYVSEDLDSEDSYSTMVTNTLPPRIVQGKVDGVPIEATSRVPQQFYCVNCQKKEMSDVRYLATNCCCFNTNTENFILAVILFSVMNNDCKDAIHTCPNCKSQVGRSIGWC